jgi:hypothetical protein
LILDQNPLLFDFLGITLVVGLSSTLASDMLHATKGNLSLIKKKNKKNMDDKFS